MVAVICAVVRAGALANPSGLRSWLVNGGTATGHVLGQRRSRFSALGAQIGEERADVDDPVVGGGAVLGALAAVLRCKLRAVDSAESPPE